MVYIHDICINEISRKYEMGVGVGNDMATISDNAIMCTLHCNIFIFLYAKYFMISMVMPK